MNRDEADPIPFSAAVIVPTYNNGGTLADILLRVERLALPVIVVNDGSTDETAQILARWLNPPTLSPASRTVLTHPQNRGKAAALQTGFAAAFKAGHSHAVTLDSDGQLDPEQIPDLLSVAQGHPQALVLGVRDSSQPDYPTRSRWGRELSNFLIWLECRQRVMDSQCGLRVYPLALLGNLQCKARRFGYETEIIPLAAWSGAEIQEVPVFCRYFPHNERISHFRPWLDSARSLAMHIRLMMMSIMRIRKNVAAWGQGDSDHTAQGVRSQSVWALFPELLTSLLHDGKSVRHLAVAIACGVFIGNQPVYGLHTVLSIFAARIFGLNTVAVVLGSFISTPPLSIALIAAAVAAGHLIIHGSMPSGADFDMMNHGLGAVAKGTLIDWITGAPFVGGVLSLCMYFVVVGLARLFHAVGLNAVSGNFGPREGI